MRFPFLCLSIFVSLYGWTQGYIANSTFASINTCCEYRVSCAPMGWWTSSASTFNFKPIRYDKNRKPIPMPALVMMLGEEGINQRSYIQSPLLCPLRKGETYVLEIDYGFDGLHFEELGIYFSDTFIHIPKKEIFKIDTLSGAFRMHKIDSLLPFQPQFNALLDTRLFGSKRRTLKLEYTATGTERFILLGNFKTDEDTRYDKVLFSRPSKRPQLFAFYKIDLRDENGIGCDCEKQIEKLNTLNRRHTFLGACSDSIEVDMNHLFDEFGIWAMMEMDTVYSNSGNENRTKQRQHDTFHVTQIEIGRAYRINQIYFAFDSAVLEPSSYPALDSLFKVLQHYPNYRIEIIGHTDSLGSIEYNQKLSQDRADAVRAYLIDKGISPKKMKAMGKGSSLPLRPNNSEEGRQQNRRVEFILQEDEAGKR